ETDDDRGTERRPRRPGVEAPLDGVGPGEVRHLAVPAVGDPAAVEPVVLALPERRDPDQVEAEGAGLLLDGSGERNAARFHGGIWYPRLVRPVPSDAMRLTRPAASPMIPAGFITPTELRRDCHVTHHSRRPFAGFRRRVHVLRTGQW